MPRPKLPVAAVVTVYHVNAHADVIIGKIIEGWQQDGGPGPDLQLASLYTDQVPSKDISRGLAKKHGFPIFNTIEGAITLGSNEVAVAGVLSIGEHGAYPSTADTHQEMFPRRRFFDEIIATFRKYNKSVPVFSDKHLAYAWLDAKHMYDTARTLGIPFMAGSSVPTTWRLPPVELPIGSEITEVMMHGYGPLEAYGFHALEGMQCMVERRKGGETGVASVQAVKGDAIWQAEKDGRWSRELLNAIVGIGSATQRPELDPTAIFYLIEYRDGLKAAVAMRTGLNKPFLISARVRGQNEPVAINFALQQGKPYEHFAHQVRAIEHMIHTGAPAYPVERTLLTTGVLDSVMQSLAQGNKLLETPHLAVAYHPVDWPFAKGVPPPPRKVP
ncbi:MAG: hypothetical protein CMJ62_16615 [Planctomycetaceae bacterium]|nr:hypothetical protein [Planctomycetaceae bacterium]